MPTPSFAQRGPAEIITENVGFDSLDYTYRGLSWLDYAKRNTNVCALEYAALELRLAIEQLLFEELVMSVGTDLDRREYETCKGNSTKLHKFIRRLAPHREKHQEFVDTLLRIEPNSPTLIRWNHSLLMKHHGALSAILHWAGEPAESTASATWFVEAVKTADNAGTYLWRNLTSGVSAVMPVAQMEPAIRQAWDDFRTGRISLDTVRTRACLALPVLRQRQRRLTSPGRDSRSRPRFR